MISELLVGFARVGVTPTPLLEFFDHHFASRINTFSDEVRMGLCDE